MEFLPDKLADKLTKIAVEQFKTSFKFKKERLVDIRKNEEFYYGRKIKVPRGRFGVPLPVMSAFIDTLMSKIDDPPIIKYSYKDIADLKISEKISSAWKIESAPQNGNWAQKDRWAKKLAIFSGRAIFKIYSESDPSYKNYLEVVDYEDFHCEPMGGGDLNNHLFVGQDNILRTKAQMLKNSKLGLYDSNQVNKLISAYNDDSYQKNDNLYVKKAERLKKLGLDIMGGTYVGQPIIRLVEWITDYEGEKYYLLFNYDTGIWVRAHKLKDVFESNLIPWVSWATHEDAFNFWSKAPADDVRPIADAMDVLFNQALDNRAKRNYGMRAYDPEIFPDPAELEWQPNGLAMARAVEKGRTIGSGIYEFQTPEVSGTIDMVAFLDKFLGTKTGITPEAQGVADTNQKVGIYFGNLQQVADRLGLYNKSYREGWVHLGKRYAWGLYEHMTEKMMVKMIGEEGSEWNELTRGEAKKAPDLDIVIEGGQAELLANEAKAKKRENALLMIAKDPILKQQVNPQWYLKEILRHGSFDEEDIRMAMASQTVSLEMLSEASQAVQQIMLGKNPKLNYRADTSFIQYIVDRAMNEDNDEVFKRLIDYAKKHIPIALDNMRRRANLSGIGSFSGNTLKQEQPSVQITDNIQAPEPIAGQTAGVSSQEATNLLQGKSNLGQ